MIDICIFYAHDNTALMAYNPCIKIQELYVHLEFGFVSKKTDKQCDLRTL